ncbi:WxL domain-containing protein [uncultured Vagococcus sp.]|uniref:WxL domain-containing protein n=1 Tax=uncultured Vagococcus sp. TaxID=189676 RepID=UPI0028D6EBA0|nr:WxL domain-containing protein [uncultured Vagococcus sp.]
MKQTKYILLSAAVLLSTVSGMTVASAAEAKSDASVTLIKDADPLRIEKTPVIQFGKQTISGSTKTYKARYIDSEKETINGVTEYLAPSVHIVDNRGTNEGWKLDASITSFKANDLVKTELAGAVLALTPTRSVKIENEPAVIPTTQEAVELGSSAKTIVTATTGFGVGKSNYFFGKNSADTTPEVVGETGNIGNDKVTLTVPGDSAKIQDATYVAELTWTLSNTP